MTERHRLALELTLRAVALIALSLFTVRALGLWLEAPHRISLLLLLTTETATVLVAVFARRAKTIALDPVSVACTVMATCYFAFLELEDGHAVVPAQMAGLVQCAGLAWQVFAKLSLGRSFGLLPAARGIVTRGAYRFVRHPIYAGYLLAHIGFLMDNLTVRNLAILSLLYALQGVRMLREERLLRSDPAYRAYCEQVRHRLVPHVF